MVDRLQVGQVRIDSPHYGEKTRELISQRLDPKLPDLEITDVSVRGNHVVIESGSISQKESAYKNVITGEIIPKPDEEKTTTPVDRLLLSISSLNGFNVYAAGPKTGLIKELLQPLLK